MTEPLRLLEDTSVDPSLRGDLELASSAQIEYPLDAGLAQFESTLAAGAHTVPTGGTVTGTKVLGWFLGAAVALGVGGWWFSQDDPSNASSAAVAINDDGEVDGATIPPTEPAPPATSASVGSGSPGEPQPDPPSDDLRAKLAAPPTSSPHRRTSAEHPAGSGGSHGAAKSSSAAKAEAAAPPSAADAADEARLINDARRNLKTDPTRALALTEQVSSKFPNGALRQERQGYAILALVALDRRDEAQREADTFLAQYPNGTLSRRIREALGR